MESSFRNFCNNARQDQNGYTLRIQDDNTQRGQINFVFTDKYGELHFTFEYDYQTNNYFRILLWGNGNEFDDDINNYRRITQLTTRYKVAKCSIINNRLCFSAESYVVSRLGVENIFHQFIFILREMFIEYYK